MGSSCAISRVWPAVLSASVSQRASAPRYPSPRTHAPPRFDRGAELAAGASSYAAARGRGLPPPAGAPRSVGHLRAEGSDALTTTQPHATSKLTSSPAPLPSTQHHPNQPKPTGRRWRRVAYKIRIQPLPAPTTHNPHHHPTPSALTTLTNHPLSPPTPNPQPKTPPNTHTHPTPTQPPPTLQKPLRVGLRHARSREKVRGWI